MKKCILNSAAHFKIDTGGRKIVLGFSKNTIFHITQSGGGTIQLRKGNMRMCISDKCFSSKFVLMTSDHAHLELHPANKIRNRGNL